jgi:RNA polymerase sigma factor (sigma-70 family)
VRVTQEPLETLQGVGTSRAGTESDLWSAALAGDGGAFTQLFDRYHGRVFRHVVGLVEVPADADDIVSATFLEFWRRRHAVRLVDGSVLPWLLVTAGNLGRNQGRRARRYRTVLRQLPREERSVDAAEEAELRLSTEERTRALGAAIARLKPVDAQLIALTAMGECSVAQAADLLGISAGAARVRIHRARARLREAFPESVLEPVEES